jgi:cytochrome b
MSESSGLIRRRLMAVWDLPIRLFHWILVLTVAGAWLTAENEIWQAHIILGLVTLTLLLFRIVWGLAGSETARFRQFVRSPQAALAHLRALRQPGPMEPHLGHNPAGALAVLAMLGLLLLQVTTGLFLSGGDLEIVPGPLNGTVSSKLEHWLEEIHELNFNFLLVMIGLHIAAILFYEFVRKVGLIRPMLTGRALMPESIPEPRPAPLWRAVIILVPLAAVAALLISRV